LAAVALHALALLAVPADAKTLRWARSIDTTSLDPHAANTGPNLLIAHHLYEPLIVRQFDGKMVPALATSWTLNPRSAGVGVQAAPGRHLPRRLAARGRGRAVLARARPLDGVRREVPSCPRSQASARPTTRPSGIRTIGPDPLLPNNLTDVFHHEPGLDAGERHPPASTRRRAVSRPLPRRTRSAPGPIASLAASPGTRTVMKAYEGYWGRHEVPLEIEEIVYLPMADKRRPDRCARRR
jgi:peptide/nickel transport system substrate-binding protein